VPRRPQLSPLAQPGLGHGDVGLRPGGTYSSEAESEGEDPQGPKKSQGYLAHVATRAIFLIDADDPAIGLLALMFIGMADVSSCVIHLEVKPGRRVNRGDEFGYFRSGGST
jgi:phosphatidylserine decarboxylase